MNNKQRLFEVMGRMDKTFKPLLNEDLGNMNYENWNPAIPYSILQNFKQFGASSFRPTDSRTSVSYYQMPDGYIIASNNNYSINKFQPFLGGIKNIDNRLFNREGDDITNEVIEDAKRYASISDNLKSFIGLDNQNDINEDTNRSFYQKWKSGEAGFTNLGGFQTALFQAYQRADSDNSAKLENAFPEWFVG